MSSQSHDRLPVSKLQTEHSRRAVRSEVRSRSTVRSRSSSAPSLINTPNEPERTLFARTELEPSSQAVSGEGPSNTTSSDPIDQEGISEVDVILAQLDYPKTVVKVVAEYQPTTKRELLCELKKEAARTKWALTPFSQRKPVELLKRQLREIEQQHGLGNTETVLDDIVELQNQMQRLRRIDKANAKWSSSAAE